MFTLRFLRSLRFNPDAEAGAENSFSTTHGHEWTRMDTNSGWKVLGQATESQSPWEFVSMRVHAWLNFGVQV